MTNGEQTATGGGRLCVLAAVSLVLGLLSLVLWAVTGVPALVLGLAGLRRINGSEGRLRGRGLAVAGMVLGGLGTLATAVGVLAMILLPMREQAAEVECRNNLRVIGLAVNGFHDDRGHYPEAVVPNPALPADEPGRHLSWLAAVLPNLEVATRRPAGPGAPAPRPGKAQQTYERLDLAKAWDDPENRPAVTTPLRWYVCPSNPNRSAPGAPALTSYVGITGLGPDSATLPATDPRAGFFGYERRLTRDELHRARGDSQTLMATETTWDNGPWAQGGPATVRPVDPARRPYAGPGRPFGGSHPDSFNALFADGAVVPFRNGIKPEFFEALVPITGEKEGQ
jgi:prepilin-type processing-associated H-X9-DG protein